MTKLIHHALLSTLLCLPTLAFAQQATSTEQAAAQIPAQDPVSAPTATEPPAIEQAHDPVPANEAAAETSAAASGDAAPGLIGAPPAGKGRIVFFRPSKFAGGAIGFKVREGDAELGKLRSGRYFVSDVDPGSHEYTVHSEAKDVLTMEVEDGETYYIQGTITMGFMAGRPNLSPSDEATFNGMAGKLKLAN